MKKTLLAASFLFLLSGGAVSIADESVQKSREYRPLMAKKVAMQLAARAADVSDIDSMRSKAWAHFDSREWSDALESFLAVLEKDPGSESAAEGLAMSLYRSGDYASAYRLGRELSEVMPAVSSLVAESVMADVRYMVMQGEYAPAREFLSHFPSNDSLYSGAHSLVADADTITAALGEEGGDKTSEPGKQENRFVNN